MSFSYYLSKFIKKLHFPAVKDSVIDKKAHVCTGAHIVNTELGKYSYIGNFSTVLNCKIGSFCSIADNCVIGGMEHPIDRLSTSPVFHKGKNCLNTNFAEFEVEPPKETIIENDVWIGNQCKIKAGVHLSTGCIVGMGSVLTKDVGPYEIWAGNPAKLIRKRFDDKTIEELLQTQWWTKSDDEIKKISEMVKTPEKLKEFFNEK